MTEYKKIQVGLFVGVDILDRATQIHYGWKCHGKPCLSSGFGYSTFSSSGTKSNTNGSNK